MRPLLKFISGRWVVLHPRYRFYTLIVPESYHSPIEVWNYHLKYDGQALQRYTIRDESAGYVAAESGGLTLEGVGKITVFTENELNTISMMRRGGKLNFDGITVERTQ